MLSTRCSGVLLHPTSLPGRFGIGDLGPSAIAFLDFLAAAGQHLWQVLPLGPTGYGDSPYQCFSAFAGNPLLVSLDRLIEEGLLTEAEATRPHEGAPAAQEMSSPARADHIDYPVVIAHRQALWPLMLDRFEATAPPSVRARFEAFCLAESAWLDDFALYMAVKTAHDYRAWTAWPPDIAA